MIKTEVVKLKNKKFKRTYSDSDFMIERDGVQYCEAIDPVDSDREYTETDNKKEEGLMYE